jgi:hypothetical protein
MSLPFPAKAPSPAVHRVPLTLEERAQLSAGQRVRVDTGLRDALTLEVANGFMPPYYFEKATNTLRIHVSTWPGLQQRMDADPRGALSTHYGVRYEIRRAED